MKIISKISLLLLTGFITACSSSVKKDDASARDGKAPTTPDSKPASTDRILGVDISHFQGNVNWGQIKSDNLKYAYAKATQGAIYQDPDYKTNVSGANDAGLAIGAYHFYMATDDPERQALHFVSTVGRVADGDMPPVLDLEQGGVSGTIDPEKFQEGVLMWLETVESKLGVKPIIYTNNPFGNEYLLNDKLADYELWIAEYTSEDAPRVPNTWKERGWLMWQRS